jgi:hypothetical protein
MLCGGLNVLTSDPPHAGHAPINGGSWHMHQPQFASRVDRRHAPRSVGGRSSIQQRSDRTIRGEAIEGIVSLRRRLSPYSVPLR